MPRPRHLNEEDDEGFERACRALWAFRAEERFEHTRRLATRKSESLITSSLKLFALQIEKQLHFFNPFTAGGYSPNENNINDILSSYLDPRGAHGLGPIALRSLMDSARGLTLGTPVEMRVRNIQHTIDRNKAADIFVRRNYHSAEFGLPDIVIGRRGDEGFLLFVENKMWHGSETVMGDVEQTKRYGIFLERESLRLAVREDCSLGIFLTPQGKSAAESQFIPIPWSTFCETLEARLEANSENEVLAKAFVRTLNWIGGAA